MSLHRRSIGSLLGTANLRPLPALFLLVAVVLWAIGACSGGPPEVQRHANEGGGGPEGPDASFDVSIGLGGSESTGGAGGMGGEPPAGAVCGDGLVEGDEACDDGNARPADGCSGICSIEAGYECPTPGELCTRRTTCGNRIIEVGEQCDDGNNDLGDGCDTDCAVEPGWACTATACVKVDTSVCGDSLVGGGEQCDDGQTPPMAGDGCDGECRVESGWQCRTPGSPCEPILTEFCGSATLSDGEECDDGNAKPGDGCSAKCQVEAGYVCPGGKDCSVACGDGLVVGDEACDDGNTGGSDGCAADCSSVEPGYTCPIAAGVGGSCVKQAPAAVCPNAKLEFGEQCDDGNGVDNDGCTNCVIDAGYRCVKVGQTCEVLPFCGDGFLDILLGEQCDDGNQDGSDGCDTDCNILSGYVCPAPVVDGTRLLGGSCRAIVCGDKKIEGTEQCDDGGKSSGDGCSDTCLLEEGWICPPNAACRARSCGDGIRAGLEACDNGEDNGTGTPVEEVVCDDGCRIVADPAKCGNGQRDPGEACDDDNNDVGDGCGIFCEPEPLCPAGGGACNSACGDGLLLPIDKNAGQECDDGNIVSGDGCSADCKVEVGFECQDVPSRQGPLVLPIVYRDFQAQQTSCSLLTVQECIDTAGCHPDFGRFGSSCRGGAPGGAESGIVQAQLGLDGKPVHVAQQRVTTVNNDPGITTDFFTLWYRDHEAYNVTVRDRLTFGEVNGSYQFTANPFFPIDNQGWGNTPCYDDAGQVVSCVGVSGGDHNFHFTSEVRYWFEYRGGENLDFYGDDDVWVFINKQLAVDIGGVHGQERGSITLHASDGTGQVCDVINPCGGASRTVDLGLQIGNVYEIVVFQAERNRSQSNYQLTLSDFNGTKSQCASVCGDGVKASDEECDDGPTNNDSYGCSTSCTLIYCGDAIKNGPEQCDDGSNNAIYSATPAGACAAGCKWAPYCGDGVVAVGIEECDGGEDCGADCRLVIRCGDGDINPGEQCDDGVLNGTLQSSCDVECQVKCGNAQIDPGEQCDPGAGNFSSGYDGCLAPVGDQPGCILGPRCGDGIKNGPEECDDGKNDGSYGTCAPGCKLGPRCGDMVIQEPAGELCDNGTSNVTYTYTRDGVGECTTACRPVGYCGDGAVTNGEMCDDGKNDGSAGSCRPDCGAWVPLVSCGNGQIDPGEQCDDGAQNGTSASECDTNCRIRCGNGITDTALGEQCDDGVNDGRYGTCNSDCTIAPYCGDGAKNGPEQCDQGSNNKADAYGAGLCTLACGPAPYCGDGRIQTDHGEECDGHVGCLSTCKWSTVQ